MVVPLSVIEDDSQHTMHYSQSLPYAHLLDHEAEDWLNSICENLAYHVKAKDFGRGCVNWGRRLSR
jgi:proteasome activator subunit 4